MKVYTKTFNLTWGNYKNFKIPSDFADQGKIREVCVKFLYIKITLCRYLFGFYFHPGDGLNGAYKDYRKI